MSSRRAHVLIVDAQRDNRDSLADLVEREGYTPLLAASGAEGLATVDAQSVDLMLLDMTTPDSHGLAVLAHLAANKRVPELPVVALTPFGDRGLHVEALTAGAIDWVSKPFDRIEVACKLRALLELSQLRHAALRHAAEVAAKDQLARVDAAVAELGIVTYELEFVGSRLMTSWVVGGQADFDPTNWPTRVHPDDRERVEGDLSRALDGTQPSFTSRLRLLEQGQYHWRQIAISFEPRTERLRGVLLDVGAQVALEEQLVHTRKMEAIGKLAGGVAHEFNNLLGVIIMFGGFVRDSLPGSDRRRSDIVQVLKAADRAASLTRQLLTFSRGEPLTKSPTNIAESLAALEAMLVPTLGADIAVRIESAPGPIIVLIDPVQFDQIVLNLCVNARDAMPRGGQLQIVLDRIDGPSSPRGRARLSVTDTGVGIPEHVRARIFEPFFTTKPRDRGTGLGLATCFAIVTDAEGTINVASSPGCGTTFTIELPCVSPMPDETTVTSCDASPVTMTAHVLLAEDEPALRQATRRVLEGIGCKVHTASDGAEAIAVLDKFGDVFDIVISDVVMPGASGHDIVAHVRRVNPRARVILTSGYDDQGDQLGTMFLAKPVLPHDLVRAVADVLAHGRASPPRPGHAQARDTRGANT